MRKMIEVTDERGFPTMIPFHRVIRLVANATSPSTYQKCTVFEMDGGLAIYISDPVEGEKAWACYRAWVEAQA